MFCLNSRSILLRILASVPAIALIAGAAPVSQKSDTALRARAEQFLSLMVAKKFRQAEALIADDTKDYYYSLAKPDLSSFSITGVDYASDGRSARVTAHTKRTILMPGAPMTPIEMPLITNWKLQRGVWMFYIDEAARNASPVGPLHPGAAAPGATPSALPQIPSPEQLARMSQTAGITLEPAEVRLDPDNPAQAVAIVTNHLPGPFTLELSSPVRGITVELPHGSIAPDQKASISITPLANTAERPTQLILRALPIGQTLALTLRWSH